MATRTKINFWIDLVSLVVMIVLVVTGGVIRFVLPPGTGHSHSLFGFGRHDIGRVHFYFAVVGVVLLVVHVYLHWTWICSVVGKTFFSKVPSAKSQSVWGLLFLCGIVISVTGGTWWASSKVERNPILGENRERRDRDFVVRSPQNASLKRDDQYLSWIGNIRTTSEESAEDVGTPSIENASSVHNEKHIEKKHLHKKHLHKKHLHKKHLESCLVGISINGRTTLSEAAHRCRLSIQQTAQYLDLPAGVNPSERLGRLKRLYGFSISDVRRLACRE